MMIRNFRHLSRFCFKNLRLFSNKKAFQNAVMGASLFSFSFSAAHLILPHVASEDESNLLDIISENSPCSDHILVQTFNKFASVEVDGEAFMTPRDFIDCVTGARPPVSTRRHVIDGRLAEKILYKTPRISSKHHSFFRRLDRNGLISFSEYLFLLSILTHNSYDLRVLFQMFDRDLSESIEKTEFLQIINLCNIKYQFGPSFEESATSNPTTIQRYFFGNDGSGKILYNDFLNFIRGLQTEILSEEFYRYSAGKDTISPLQLSQAILRYADLPNKQKKQGLERVAESILFEKDNIDFKSYCSFFNLLFQYEDLYSALKMFLFSNRSISKEEFQRASRAVTGTFMNDVIVNTLFLLFDADGDGHLSADEFISVTRSYLARGTRGRLVDESKVRSYSACVGTKMRSAS